MRGTNTPDLLKEITEVTSNEWLSRRLMYKGLCTTGSFSVLISTLLSLVPRERRQKLAFYKPCLSSAQLQRARGLG